MSRTKLLSVIGQKISYINLSVVGNPTINNGIVSDFSSSDYLQMSNFPTSFSEIEIITKVKVNKSGNNAIFALGNGSTGTKKFYSYLTSTSFQFRYLSSLDNTAKLISINYNFGTDIFYYTRVKIYPTKIVLGYSLDGQNWIEEEFIDNISIALSESLRYGVIANNSWYLNGVIDFNNSYSIKDGTKYILTLP